MEKAIIPKRFRDKYKELAKDPEEFFSILSQPLDKSFRVNTIKADVKEVVESLASKGITLEKAKWWDKAFTTKEFGIGNTMEHFMGYIYIQELTSMLPPLAIAKELEKASLVLDAAAAPGSKTTQMAAIMGNRGCLIANDINYQRTKALKFNFEKTGILNTVLVNQDFRFFRANEGDKFDCILLDAPCSSEGTIRKDPTVLNDWSEKRVFGMSRLQKSMVLKAFDLLKTGGIMVYSTCTFAPEENEEVVKHLLENREGVELEKVELDRFKLSEGVHVWGKQDFGKLAEKVCRVWPQDNNTDGFFLAKVKKV